jgi:RHS repeat-associated protein
VLLSQADYNEIGQVMTKHLHSSNSGSSFLQNIAYTYNERGWLTGSSAPLFATQLEYNSNPANISGVTAQYNGNIASQVYTSYAQPTKNYVYGYDYLNRLTSGISSDGFNESGITYDLMGNIATLNRYQAGTVIDNLVYTYSGNRVQGVNDLSTDNSPYGYRPGNYTAYNYDVNGNMTAMPTPPDGSTPVANINIQYNQLNLPQTITGGKTITYTYDATGTKLRKVSSNNGSTDYISGIQYDQTVGGTAPTISFIQTEEGKAVSLSAGGYDYYYYLGDNLGNTRVTFDTKMGSATVLQQDDYYPFGYEISRGTITSPKNEYLYNGKELQPELGTFDYGFRQYDPVIARWNVPDPDAENYESTSSYAYVLNNPINLGDVDGRDTVRHLKEVFINATKPKPKPEPIEVEPLKEIKPIEPGVFIKPPVFLMPILTLVFVLMPANYDDHEEADNLRLMNARRDPKHPGSYTIKFKNGKRYHGKGSFSRALQSAKQIAKDHETSFEIYNIDWTPSTSNEQSFRDEAKRLEADGGKNNTNNYNQIDSPGSHKYKQDQ